MVRERLRFGVIGLGEFGEAYLSILRDLRDVLDIEVVALCSRSAPRARALAQQYGVPRWYDDSGAFALDAGVDVVCVVTSEAEHADPVRAALAAGRHVIVEKPLATRLHEVDALTTLAAQTGRQLLVGHLLRFAPLYRGIADRVHAGQLGEVVSLHTRRNRPGPLVARYRRTHPALETGILDIDVMLWLTRARVERVTAVVRTINPGPTPDLVWGILEFSSGAIGVLETSWLAPVEGGVFTDDALSIVGSRGTARIDLSRAPAAAWSKSGYELIDPFYSPTAGSQIMGAFREQMISFIASMRTGQPNDVVPLADVRHGLEVALALIKAGEEGRTVAVETAETG
jgi:UDP-N-acetylglucosamine 3-dehydrogenase